jgi:hypothetical protein
MKVDHNETSRMTPRKGRIRCRRPPNMTLNCSGLSYALAHAIHELQFYFIFKSIIELAIFEFIFQAFNYFKSIKSFFFFMNQAPMDHHIFPGPMRI